MTLVAIGGHSIRKLLSGRTQIEQLNFTEDEPDAAIEASSGVLICIDDNFINDNEFDLVECTSWINQSVIPLANSSNTPIALFYMASKYVDFPFMSKVKKFSKIFVSEKDIIHNFLTQGVNSEKIAELLPLFDPRKYSPIESYHKQRNDFCLVGIVTPDETREVRNLKRMIACLNETGALITRYENSGEDEVLAGTFDNRIMEEKNPYSRHKWSLVYNEDGSTQTNYNSEAINSLASGNIVFSTYNDGINSYHPSVLLLDSLVDFSSFFDTLTHQEDRKLRLAGIRSAFSNHTVDSFMSVLEDIFPTLASSHQRPLRTLIHCEDLQWLEKFLLTQKRPKHIFDIAKYTSCVTDLDSDFDVVLHLVPSEEYTSNILLDLLIPFFFADVNSTSIVRSDFQDLSSTNTCRPIVRGIDNLHDTNGWARRSTTGSIECGYKPGQTDPMKHVTVYSDQFLNSRIATKDPSNPSEPKLSVIIPVYNNGRHLENKALRSLRRSSVFKEMEIILVDDGSSDTDTINVIKNFTQESKNSKAFFFPQGGSGSASRPRNMGLELSTAPWITYLDPDNEVINDGFALLLAEAEKEKADLTIGNTVRYDGRAFPNSYVLPIRAALKDTLPDTELFGLEVLEKINFMAVSPQVLIANGDWLRSLNLQQVPGAVGQDTYFSQQMIANSRSINLVNKTIGIYYSAVVGSTVNYVNSKFFEKYLDLEADRSQWLKDVGIFVRYTENRLEGLFQHWYIQKLKRVPESEVKKSLSALRKIWSFYGKPTFNNKLLQDILETDQSDVILNAIDRI